VVDGHALDDRLQEHGFPGPGGGYDECPLAVADGRDEVNRAPCQLGSALGGATGFELEFSLRIRSDEGAEIGASRGFIGTGPVDLLDVDDDYALAMVVSGGGENLVAAAEHVLPHDVRRQVGITWLGEVAVRGSANESALALWIEPPRCLSIRNHWRHRCAVALALIGARRILLRLALSAAPALIAAAPSVVTIGVALAGVAILILIAVALLGSATQGLRVVVPLLLLLLLLIPASAVAGSVRGSRGR
jgi:hypothetical protein